MPQTSANLCSVDLRDGNQFAVIPMSLMRNDPTRCLKVGFNEIEIGFPAASETE